MKTELAWLAHCSCLPILEMLDLLVADGTWISRPNCLVSYHSCRQLERRDSQLTLCSINCRYLNSFTSNASYAAWKKEVVNIHLNPLGTWS